MKDNNFVASSNAAVTSNPAESSDYADLVGHQQAAGREGRKQLWPRSNLVLPSELGFFKNETVLYL